MRIRLVSLVVALTALTIAAPTAGAATFTVTSIGDGADIAGNDNVCDALAGPGVECTLRAAIRQANAAAGAGPHAIGFDAAIQNATIAVVSSDLDAIAVAGTTINGCSATPDAAQPCVGLRPSTAGGTGLEVDAADVTIRGLAISRFATGISVDRAGMILSNSDIGVRVDHTTVEGMARGVLLTSTGARIGGSSAGEGNAFAGNGDGLAIWGADSTGVYGNRFGLRRDGAVAGNGRAIAITAQSALGVVLNEAEGNAVGAQSNAAAEDGSCGGYCNLIAGSSVAGIDLDGNVASGESPAASTTIAGNWIGLDAAGDAAANAVAIHVGDGGKLVGGDTAGAMIGGPTPSRGNLISGNAAGIDQAGGRGILNVMSNVFGVAPDHATALPNVGTNATLGGDVGAEVYVQYNHFGATGSGLVLEGPRPIVIGNFFTPFVGSYADAAVVIGPGASDALIGTNVGGCIPIPQGCNIFGGTATGDPAIWIRGADGARISANLIGHIPFAAPLAGPPVRITDGPLGPPQTTSGALVGNEDPSLWNALTRTAGPAVEISGGATGVVVAGNEGIAAGSFNNPLSLFTDLLPTSGPGNSGPANGAIQPPTVGTATTAGIAGTGTAGATIRVLQQWRADDLAAGIDGPGEGYTLPTTPAVTTVAGDGTWSLAFGAKVPVGQKLTASQTTAAGSSEYAALRTAASAPDLPVVQITGGPTGSVVERTATFTFTTPTPGATLECVLDGDAFVACTSPMTVGPLEPGGHQFRVQARVGQQVSFPASRVWSIETPAPRTPTGPVSPGPAANSSQRFASLVSLPSTRRCVSRRKLRLRLRKPSGTRIVFAEIRVAGRPTRTVSGRALSAAIDLRGLPRGRFRVRVRVVLSNGRVVSGTRTYRTCAPKRRR